MSISSFRNDYIQHTRQLMREHTLERAMSLVVGGDFEAVGRLEYFLLRQYGLQPEHTVIDVGCGSGRLACQLKDYLTGTYIGTDVVPELYQYAAHLVQMPDWRFYDAPGLTLPEPDQSADFICFFSVFTHLLHEESYQYLVDARRVLAPGGKIIFSFLEYNNPLHWNIFEGSMADKRPEKVLNQFLSRDIIRIWAEHLQLSVTAILDGDAPAINLLQPVTWDDGGLMFDKGHFSQSVCILCKPSGESGEW